MKNYIKNVLFVMVLAVSANPHASAMQQKNDYLLALKPCEFNLFAPEMRTICEAPIMFQVADVQFGPAGHMYVMSTSNYSGCEIHVFQPNMYMFFGGYRLFDGYVYKMLIHPKVPLVYVLGLYDGDRRQHEAAFVYKLKDDLSIKEEPFTACVIGEKPFIKPFTTCVQEIDINVVTDLVYVVHEDGNVTIHTSDGKLLNEQPSVQKVHDICCNQKTGHVYVLHDYTDKDGGLVTAYDRDDRQLTGGKTFAKNVHEIYTNQVTGDVYVLDNYKNKIGGLITAYTCDGLELNKDFAKNVHKVSVNPKTGNVYVLHDYSYDLCSMEDEDEYEGNGARVTVYTSDGQMLKPLIQGLVENIFFAPNGKIYIQHKHPTSGCFDNMLYPYSCVYKTYFQQDDCSIECNE